MFRPVRKITPGIHCAHHLAHRYMLKTNGVVRACRVAVAGTAISLFNEPSRPTTALLALGASLEVLCGARTKPARFDLSTMAHVKPNPVSSPKSAVDECSRRVMCHEHGETPCNGFQRRAGICIDEVAKTGQCAGVG